MTDKITIDYLADHPELIQVCAAWGFGQWGCQVEGKTLDTTLAHYKEGARKDAIPLVLVALVDGKPAGQVALIEQDCPERPDLSPWMASVFVHPAFRAEGLANRLVECAESEARRLGIKTLYLITQSAQGLYAQHGWVEIDTVPSRFGGMDTVMEKKL